MAAPKEGARAKIVVRPVTPEDRKSAAYFEHMAGLTGTIGNVYSDGRSTLVVDEDSLSEITRSVHKEAVRRMREKFLDNLSEEGKKQLTKEELEFNAHFVHLLNDSDLESIG